MMVEKIFINGENPPIWHNFSQLEIDSFWYQADVMENLLRRNIISTSPNIHVNDNGKWVITFAYHTIENFENYLNKLSLPVFCKRDFEEELQKTEKKFLYVIIETLRDLFPVTYLNILENCGWKFRFFGEVTLFDYSAFRVVEYDLGIKQKQILCTYRENIFDEEYFR